MTATGAHRRRLASSRALRSYGGSYSPGGKRIVFVRAGSSHGLGLPGDLWVMNADRSHKRRLTFTPGIDESDPAWSPNGKGIAFSAQGGRAGKRSGVWIMDADGRHRRPLAATRLYDSRPSWSPDGTKIAYVNVSPLGNSNGLQIYVVKTSGGSPTNLTNDPSVEDIQPSWSPNGRKILFSSDRGDLPDSNFQSDLWMMNPDGSGAERVTNTADADEYSPAWSPDGRWIAYAVHDSQSIPTGLHDNRITQISVARSDGSQARMLTHPCRSDCTIKDDISNDLPSWQPLHR
jgi:Tol biopolymer transport system component